MTAVKRGVMDEKSEMSPESAYVSASAMHNCGPVQLKKMKPLSKTDVLDMYAELGMNPDLHEGFYDLNKDFKVQR